MTTADDDQQMRTILEKAKTIAVVGIKNNETEDAYRIPKYMQDHGARVLPVNPKLDSILGEDAYARLSDIEEPIDLVNLFRAPENIPEHAREILELPQRPKAVWLQLGIYHGKAAAQLRAAGIDVVQDRCIMVEHRRLIDA
ncbi:MAG: CoA-binding protein [bacterium]|nr:CoA-binding protein [bacterium]